MVAAAALPGASVALCKGCSVRMPELGHHGFRPFEFADFAFCCSGCAGKWALLEVPRLQGWLRRISADTRGTAAGLAQQALRGNLPATWGKRA